jgi:hypothetical protein
MAREEGHGAWSLRVVWFCGGLVGVLLGQPDESVRYEDGVASLRYRANSPTR